MSSSQASSAGPAPPLSAAPGSSESGRAIQAATQDVSTKTTIDEEQRLILSAQKAQQNQLLKALALEKNQNIAGKANDVYVSDFEYGSIVNNRFKEAARLQIDIQNIGDRTMMIQQRHRTLDQQINLNRGYGIPIV